MFTSAGAMNAAAAAVAVAAARHPVSNMWKKKFDYFYSRVGR